MTEQSMVRIFITLRILSQVPPLPGLLAVTPTLYKSWTVSCQTGTSGGDATFSL